MGDDLGDEWEMEGFGGGDEEASALDSAAGMINATTSTKRGAITNGHYPFSPRWPAGRLPLTAYPAAVSLSRRRSGRFSGVSPFYGAFAGILRSDWCCGARHCHDSTSVLPSQHLCQFP